MAIHSDSRRSPRLIWLWPITVLAGLAAMGFVSWQLISVLQSIGIGIRETHPSFSSTGPTMIQLERLQYLVSTRVHVADVLVGESRWLQGSWIIQGDGLIGVDMSRAEIKGNDDKLRTAVIVLPQPTVISARVNHEKSQQWDIKSRSWIPMASAILGDRQAMEKQAMLEAQQLIERAASADEYKEAARRGIQGMLAELYGGVGWNVSIQWKQ
jgi:Protein of unknown function (DUF4230)